MEQNSSTKKSFTSARDLGLDLEFPVLPACASVLPKVHPDVVLAWCEELRPLFEGTAEEALRDKVNVEFVL